MKLKWLIFLLLPFLMSACVSSKKYKALEMQNNDTALQLQKAQNDLENVKGERNQLDNELKKTNALLADEQETKKDLERRFNALQNDYKELEDRYDLLLKQNQLQLANASSAAKKLNEALIQKEKELAEKAQKLATLEKSLNDSKAGFEEAQAQLDEATRAIAEREKRLNELEAILKAQEQKTEELRKTIADALLGFKQSDLTVEEKNGKVYVSLSQNLLFASGSTTIDRKGYAAIKKLADVLNKNTDIDIMVEGHTDNVPLRGRAGMQDNWDLSVIRSTSLVRELIKNGVDPKRITAAGRGEFFPIADNESGDGRAKNRRSEIILSPKLDDLFNLIK